jgi:transposase
MPARPPLVVTESDQAVLRRWSAAAGPARRAQRARIVLLAAQGLPDAAIARRLGVSRPVAATWRGRYARGGLAALADRPRPGRPRQVSAGEVVACTLRVAPRTRGVTSCSRRVAAELGISTVTVSRAWRLARVNVASSGAVLYESDPPVPISDQLLVGVCVHRGCGIAIMRPRSAGAPEPDPARVRLRRGHLPDLRRALRRLTPDEALTVTVVGHTLGIWGGLELATGLTQWHIAPTAASWLAVVEGMTGPGQPGPQRAGSPGGDVAADLGRLLATAAGRRGWGTWTAESVNELMT